MTMNRSDYNNTSAILCRGSSDNGRQDLKITLKLEDRDVMEP